MNSATISICLILIGYMAELPVIVAWLDEASEWYNQPLCVLKMGQNCPSGFYESQIKLSVPIYVNPKDTGQNGEVLVQMGYAGETSLTRNFYDGLYTLTLTACCKA